MQGFAQVVTLAQLATAAKDGVLLPGSRAVAAGTSPVLTEATKRAVGQILLSDIKGRIRDGVDIRGRKFRPLRFPRPNGGNVPLRDTGKLEASLSVRSDATGWVLATTHPGARLLNAGGVVRPKKGKFLAIPLTREAKRAGSPRRMKGTAKVPLFAKRIGGKLVGHFLLVRRVKVPPREFMGVSERAARLAGDAILDGVARQWGTNRVR